MHIPKMKVQEKMRDALTLGFPAEISILGYAFAFVVDCEENRLKT
jgi:hypothetical protein